MNKPISDGSVIVLGAGATKAFLPAAPLAVDDYGLERLLDEFRQFRHAQALLEFERKRRPTGLINIEDLMTRLQGRMPYDSHEAVAQQSVLFSALMREFRQRISTARQKEFHQNELDALARVCIHKNISCITFNYDDVFDEALWNFKPLHRGHRGHSHPKHWHPDGGYGFFCRPSSLAINDMPQYMNKTSMLLLKLHGSINWYPKKGENAPYRLDAIHHEEDWFALKSEDYLDTRELIARHFEPTPFIVPPVLDKSVLTQEPILQLVWALPQKTLKTASHIHFVGYSMPATDLAAAFLFGESIEDPTHRISVINFAQTQNHREQVQSAYRKVFPQLTNDQFTFDGALEWVRNTCSQEDTAPS